MADFDNIFRPAAIPVSTKPPATSLSEKKKKKKSEKKKNKNKRRRRVKQSKFRDLQARVIKLIL